MVWGSTWLSTAPPVALVGLALTGLGIAGHYPLAVSLLMASVPGQGDRASSRVSIGIAVASGGAPFTLGAVADVTSTHTAFLAVPFLLGTAATALLGSVWLTRRPPPRSPSRAGSGAGAG